MANVKISQLPLAAAVGSTDVVPVVSGGITKQALISSLLSLIYPIGSIYITISAVNPNITFGFGTWVAHAAGRVLVGLGAAPFNAIGNIGGAETVTLTTPQIPSHSHTQAFTTNPTVGSEGSMGSDGPSDEGFVGETQLTGGGQAHNNLQPYIVVNMFRRTA